MKYDYKYFRDLYDANYKNVTWDGNSKLRSERFKRISKFVDDHKKLLDYGGGNGDLSIYLPENTDYTILDLSKEHKLDKFKHTELFNDIYVQTPDETFDVVVLSEVLEHIPNAYETLREVNRILKKDGLLIITVPNAFSILSIFRSIFGINLDPSKEHLYLFDWSMLTNLSEAAGFKLKHKSTFWMLQAKVYDRLSFLEPIYSAIFKYNGTQLLCVYEKN